MTSPKFVHPSTLMTDTQDSYAKIADDIERAKHLYPLCAKEWVKRLRALPSSQQSGQEAVAAFSVREFEQLQQGRTAMASPVVGHLPSDTLVYLRPLPQPEAAFALVALVAAGHVSRDKVDQALSIARGCSPLPVAKEALPEFLPCEVKLPPHTTFGEGVKFSTFLRGLTADYRKGLKFDRPSPAAPKPDEDAKDAARLDWIEKSHTLHQTVEMLYVVDGYEVEICRDSKPICQPFRGKTLRAAIDAAMLPPTERTGE